MNKYIIDVHCFFFLFLLLLLPPEDDDSADDDLRLFFLTAEDFSLPFEPLLSFDEVEERDDPRFGFSLERDRDFFLPLERDRDFLRSLERDLLDLFFGNNSSDFLPVVFSRNSFTAKAELRSAAPWLWAWKALYSYETPG